VLLTLESQGVNVSVLWWSLALGVGLGGNASHIGSTANVYVVTMSERLAREQHQPELAITPAYWVQNALPITLLSLVVASLFLFFGYDYLYIAH